jgi:hypothetical protein
MEVVWISEFGKVPDEFKWKSEELIRYVLRRNLAWPVGKIPPGCTIFGD